MRLYLVLLLLLSVVGLVFVVWLLTSQFPAHHERMEHHHHIVIRYGAVPFNPPYAGVDYYYSADFFGGCPNWTWLQGSCYTHNPNGGSTTEQQQLASDAGWIARTHTGLFQRVWVMLDQGIRWDSSGNYAGLDPAYLSNLDDALAKFHANGISVDTVLLEASKGSSDKNQFQAQALDGSHPALRAGYLQALKDFAAHVAANPTDAATIVVADELNEAYFQTERFGVSDATIHAFLHDEYVALKSGDPALVVTASDTTRLLKDYATWWPMYSDAVDVIDDHAYSDTPWNDAGLWANAHNFTVPWFVGEAGCGTGNISCTYNSGNAQCSQPSTCALSVDGWWLANLKNDGARAVAVEARQVAWSYPSGSNSQTATLVGAKIQQYFSAGPAASTPPPAPTIPPLPSPTAYIAPPTAVPSSPAATAVAAGVYFNTRAPGSALPTEAQCAAAVRPAGEVRTDNDTANHTVPSATQEQTIQSASWSGVGYGAADPNLHRVTGNFTGTTDQILQWAACKWGLDENIVRAQAVNESHWHMNDRGDYTTTQAWCPPGTIDSTGGCYQSYGITQIKWHWNPWVWPMSRDMTAFAADFTYATWRSCYDGKIGYLQTNGSGYGPGDVWGCIGFWYSGQWHDSGGNTYISQVQGYLATKPWLTWPGWSEVIPAPGAVATPVPATSVPTSVPNTQVPATSVPNTQVPAPTSTTAPEATLPPATATVRPCPTVPANFADREPDGDSDDGPFLTATAQAKIGCKGG